MGVDDDRRRGPLGSPASAFPFEANVKVDKAGQMIKKAAFYVRIGNGTREIADTDQRRKYVAGRWGSADTVRSD